MLGLDQIGKALSGINKAVEANPQVTANVLGQLGAAIAPQGSWQQALGGLGASMAQAEQKRKFLSDLFADIPGAAEQAESALKVPSNTPAGMYKTFGGTRQEAV